MYVQVNIFRERIGKRYVDLNLLEQQFWCNSLQDQEPLPNPYADPELSVPLLMTSTSGCKRVQGKQLSKIIQEGTMVLHFHLFSIKIHALAKDT